jgi:hypothetical protein
MFFTYHFGMFYSINHSKGEGKQALSQIADESISWNGHF